MRPWVRNSVWWAWGSISPASHAPFNVHELPAGDDATVSVIRGLVVLRIGPGLAQEFGGPALPEEILTAVVGAYALIEGVAFDWTLQGGLRLIEGSWDSLPEYFLWTDRFDRDIPSPLEYQSLRMKASIALARRARSIVGYRLALRDLHAAIRDSGDDRFVFGYRAIEDVARAVSQTGAVVWPELHAHLGTNEGAFRARISALHDARHAAAHGEGDDPALTFARQNRDRIVLLARQVISQAMVRDERMPLAGSDVNGWDLPPFEGVDAPSTLASP